MNHKLWEFFYAVHAKYDKIPLLQRPITHNFCYPALLKTWHFAFSRKTVSSVKQANLCDMFKRASKIVSTANIVASSNTLPSPSTISDKKNLETAEKSLMSRISRWDNMCLYYIAKYYYKSRIVTVKKLPKINYVSVNALWHSGIFSCLASV